MGTDPRQWDEEDMANYSYPEGYDEFPEQLEPSNEVPFGNEVLPTGAAAILHTLRAAVYTGRLGGKDDGRERYPIEGFIQAPDKPDPVAGRCMKDGIAWDDHRRPYPDAMLTCPGLSTQPGQGIQPSSE